MLRYRASKKKLTTNFPIVILSKLLFVSKCAFDTISMTLTMLKVEWQRQSKSSAHMTWRDWIICRFRLPAFLSMIFGDKLTSELLWENFSPSIFHSDSESFNCRIPSWKHWRKWRLRSRWNLESLSKNKIKRTCPVPSLSFITKGCPKVCFLICGRKLVLSAYTKKVTFSTPKTTDLCSTFHPSTKLLKDT